MKLHYKARTKEGELQVGSIEASTKETAVNILSSHNLFILSLDSDEKQRGFYLQKLIYKVTAEIEVGHIYCNKKDAKFLKAFNVESVSVIGGIIAENREKTVRTDYSFETILQSIKENELQSVNKILFA